MNSAVMCEVETSGACRQVDDERGSVRTEAAR